MAESPGQAERSERPVSPARADASEQEGLSIGQNVLWNSVGNLVYLAAQWLLSYLVVRLLGFGPAGVFSLAMSVGNTVCALAAYSMRNYQASDVDGMYSDRQYVLSRAVTSGVSLLATVAFVLAQPYEPQTALCVVIYSTYKISEAVSDVYQAIQQKHLRMDYVCKAYVLKSVSELAVFALALATTRSLTIGVCALSAASFAVILGYERTVALRLAGDGYGRRGQRYAGDATRTVWRLLADCVPMAVYGVLFNTLSQVPRYLLQSMSGDEVLGIYASVAMPVMLVQVAANYFFVPLTTPMAHMLRDGRRDELVRMFGKVVAGILAVTVLAFALAAVAGEPVYVLMYGEQIREHLYLVNPLILCSTLTALSWFFANVLTILRRLRLLLVGSALAFGVALATSAPLIGVMGMNGASFACAAALATFVAVALFGLVGELRGASRAGR